MIAHFLKFFSVGLVATLSHFAVATGCAYALPIHALTANFIGFCAAVAISYFGHARVTFQAETHHAFHAPRFIVAALLGLGVSSAITAVFHDCLKAPFWLAMVIAAILVPAFNYGLLRLWVFSYRSNDASRRI